jgi:histidinol phosphatase-like enzyme
MFLGLKNFAIVSGMEHMHKSRVIAFDFDGVIAQYAGFVGKDHVLPPNDNVVAAMHALKELGHRILVHSTRGDAFLKAYCEKFSVPFDYINRRPDKEGENPGKPIAYVYIDDNSICYRGQSAQELVDQVESFKPYWRS